VRMSALHLPRGSFLEALGSAFVGFQFRHKSSSKRSALSRQRPARQNGMFSDVGALKQDQLSVSHIQAKTPFWLTARHRKLMNSST